MTATSDAGLVALELDPATDSFAAGRVPPMALGLVANEADETGTEGSEDGS